MKLIEKLNFTTEFRTPLPVGAIQKDGDRGHVSKMAGKHGKSASPTDCLSLCYCILFPTN